MLTVDKVQSSLKDMVVLRLYHEWAPPAVGLDSLQRARFSELSRVFWPHLCVDLVLVSCLGVDHARERWSSRQILEDLRMRASMVDQVFGLVDKQAELRQGM